MATGGGLIGALRVSLGLDTAQFEAGTKRARTVASRDAAAIQKSLSGIRSTLNGLVAAATATALVAVGKRALEYASSLAEVAQQSGVAAKELQEYRFAGSQVGISNEEMDKSLAKLTRTMGEALAGNKAQATTFRELGVAITDANGRVLSAGEVIPKLADALSRITNPATRARLEVELFGKAGQKLDTLLTQGAAGINNLRDAAQKLGIVLSDKQIQDADETADRLNALKQVLEANIAGAVANNAGAILSLANALFSVANAAAAVSAKLPGALNIAAGVAIGGRVAGPPGALIGGLAGLTTALNDRIQNDPYGVRGLSKKDIVARTRYVAGQLREMNKSRVFGDSDIYNEFSGELKALGTEISQRINTIRAGQQAPTKAVGAGALPTVKTEPKKPKVNHNEERFERELAGLQDDQLQLQERIKNDVGETARLEHLRIETQQDAYEHDVDLRKKAGELTDAQATQLKIAYAANATRQHTLVNWKLDDELTSEELDLTRARLENANDVLQGELNSARTQEERRRIQLAILANEIALERASLDAVLAKHESTKTEKEIAKAKLDQLDSEYGQKADAIRRGTMGPLAEFVDQMPRSIGELNEALDHVAVNGLQSLNDQLAEAIVNGKSLGSVFHNVASQIIADLLRIAIQESLIKPLAQQLGSGGGFNISSIFGGSPSSNSFADISAALGTFKGNLPGMATGGSFRVGGLGMGDTQMLSIGGIPRAMVDPRETVTVNPANDRGGPREMHVYVHEADGFASRVEVIADGRAVKQIGATGDGLARKQKYRF